MGGSDPNAIVHPVGPIGCCSALAFAFADEAFEGDSTGQLATVDLLGIELGLGNQFIYFDVDSGLKLDATFKFSQLLDVGVLTNYELVVEKRVGDVWTTVGNGENEAWLLKLGLLITGRQWSV